METKIIDKLEEAFTPEQIPKQMKLPKALKWYYLKYFTKEAQLYRKSVDKYILSTSTHIEIQKYLLDKKCKAIISAIVLLLTTFFALMPFFPNVFNSNWFGLHGDVYNWTDKIIITLIPPTFGLANWSITKITKYGKVIKIINRLIPWIILIYWVIKTLTRIFFHNTKCEECKKSKNDGDLEYKKYKHQIKNEKEQKRNEKKIKRNIEKMRMDKNICWMIIDGKECFKKVSKNWNGIGVPACEEHTKIFQELMKKNYDYGVNNQKEYLDQYEKGFKKGIEETRKEIKKKYPQVYKN